MGRRPTLGGLDDDQGRALILVAHLLAASRARLWIGGKAQRPRLPRRPDQLRRRLRPSSRSVDAAPRGPRSRAIKEGKGRSTSEGPGPRSEALPFHFMPSVRVLGNDKPGRSTQPPPASTAPRSPPPSPARCPLPTSRPSFVGTLLSNGPSWRCRGTPNGRASCPRRPRLDL